MLNATDDIVYMCTIYSVGRDEHGKGVIVRGFSTDVTQYKQMAERHRSMEVELRQAHKLEAVGQLAAGSSTAADKPVNIFSTSLDRIAKLPLRPGRMFWRCPKIQISGNKFTLPSEIEQEPKAREFKINKKGR